MWISPRQISSLKIVPEVVELTAGLGVWVTVGGAEVGRAVCVEVTVGGFVEGTDVAVGYNVDG